MKNMFFEYKINEATSAIRPFPVLQLKLKLVIDTSWAKFYPIEVCGRGCIAREPPLRREDPRTMRGLCLTGIWAVV